MSDLHPESDEPERYASWDEFWAEIEGAEEVHTETIRGVKVRVPTEVTVRFARRAELLQDSTRMEDITSLLGDLYGQEVLEAWIDAGMGMLEFQTVLAWSIARVTGEPLTFRQALERVRAMHQAKAEGKAIKGRSARSSGTGT